MILLKRVSASWEGVISSAASGNWMSLSSASVRSFCLQLLRQLHSEQPPSPRYQTRTPFLSEKVTNTSIPRLGERPSRKPFSGSTRLISNLLTDVQDPFATEVEAQVISQVQDLVNCTERMPGTLIVVSNEVGLGLVPSYPLGRAYRDLLGRANQYLAHKADEVYLLVAGISMPVKNPAASSGASSREKAP